MTRDDIQARITLAEAELAALDAFDNPDPVWLEKERAAWRAHIDRLYALISALAF